MATVSQVQPSVNVNASSATPSTGPCTCPDRGDLFGPDDLCPFCSAELRSIMAERDARRLAAIERGEWFEPGPDGGSLADLPGIDEAPASPEFLYYQDGDDFDLSDDPASSAAPGGVSIEIRCADGRWWVDLRCGGTLEDARSFDTAIAARKYAAELFGAGGCDPGEDSPEPDDEDDPDPAPFSTTDDVERCERLARAGLLGPRGRGGSASFSDYAMW